jgi:hypothetical protein
MSFFSRPDLTNTQFKQLSGNDSILTLSGQTQIATISGLTLADGSGSTIIITARNPVVGNIMTFDGTEIRLMSPNPSGATGNSGNYFGNSPTTCTVGGLSGGSSIYGCTIENILQDILVPTVNPTLTAPSSIFNISLSNPYEVGCVVSVVGCTCLSVGSINPQYSSASSCRSNGAISHNYIDFNCGTFSCFGNTCTCTRSLPAYTVVAGIRTAYGSVSYCAGVQPKNSSGANYSTPLTSGTTTPVGIVICGLLPYFYGKVASGGCPAGVNRPTPTCALVISGTKVLLDSSNIISINFNSTSDDYIWFGIPSGLTKTCWCVNALNNGAIGGAVSAGGNLFPAKASVNPVTTVCWSGRTYNVYISNYQTAVSTPMTIY